MRRAPDVADTGRRILSVEATPEIRATLRRIDEARDRILSQPVPEPEILERLERDFMVDAVYHGMRLSGGQMTREQIAAVLEKEGA